MSRNPAPSEERTYTKAEVTQIVEDRLARDRKERREARVISEPRTYGIDSPHSYFFDRTKAFEDPMGAVHRDAHARLAAHAREVAHEIEQRSDEGLRAERIIREWTREEDPVIHRRRYGAVMREVRALTTGGGTTVSASSSGSAFVAPAIVLDEWAMFRGIERAFADQCHQIPLPPYGLQVYVPAWTSADSATQQTEAGAVSETDPTATLQSGQVQTITGQLTLTQQFVDRGFGRSGAIDQIVAMDLNQRLDQQIDVYTITQAITNGAAVAGNAVYSTANLYQDMAKGREQLTDTAGTRLRPTHVFTTSDLFSFVTRQVDSSARPILTPQFAPGYNPMTDVNDGQNGGQMPVWARFTGAVLPGGVYWFTDDNIPASGANTQIIVSAPDAAILLMESPDPILSVFPQTLAGNLEVVLNLRKYVAVITRHATGTATITSAAYPTTAL